MLRRIRIENLAVVEDVTLEFTSGLNVLTGSTGAGKSLIVGAVNLLLGERVPADLIRRGCDEARVDAVFDPPSAAVDAGLTAPIDSGDALTLARRVSRSGRSSASINGRAVPLKDLRALSSLLVEPHGQNIQWQLRDPRRHVEYLDAFVTNTALRAAYVDALGALRRAEGALARHDAEAASAAEKRELYAHRVEEINRIAPRAGEKADLETRARLMANSEKIYASLSATCAALHDDDRSALALVGESARRAAALSGVDPRIAAMGGRLAEAAAILSDVASEARAVIEELDFEPAEVERVQERLDALARLERRYGAAVDSLLEQRDSWKRILADLDDGGHRRVQLVRECERSAQDLAAAGAALTDSRRAAARALDPLVTRRIRSLAMPGAEFRTDIRHASDPDSPVRVEGAGVHCQEDGLDVVRMRVRTNPGEAEGDLDAIASSGELSRVALVLKQLTVSVMGGTTLIFDEVDAGVGADLGEAIAENLLALARKHQIICITHMPQIAARGHSHLVVHKKIVGDRTSVGVRAADGNERTREIARMLGGGEGSDRRLALAAEMLARSRPDRRRKRVRP